MRGHEFTPENTYITKDGTQACRTCHALRARGLWSAGIRRWNYSSLSDEQKAQRRIYARRWREKNPEKVKAYRVVANAIKQNKLSRGACEKCGRPEAEAHHDDYTKPLEIRWLCKDHHAELHRIYSP